MNIDDDICMNDGYDHQECWKLQCELPIVSMEPTQDFLPNLNITPSYNVNSMADRASPLMGAPLPTPSMPFEFRPPPISVPSFYMDAMSMNSKSNLTSFSSDGSPVSSASSSSKRQKRRLSSSYSLDTWGHPETADDIIKRLEIRLTDQEEKHSRNLNATIKHYENEIRMLQEYVWKLKRMFNYQPESNFCISPRSLERFQEDERLRTLEENKRLAVKLEDEEQKSRVMDIINQNKLEEEERAKRRKLAAQLIEQEKNRRMMTPEDEAIQAFRRKSSLKLANQVVELTSIRKFSASAVNTMTSSKVGRWKKEESDKFAEGLKKFGRDWDAVANYVGTRNVVQVRSHAQKYFKKMAKDRAREAAHAAQEAGLSGDALISAVSAAAYSVNMSTAQQPRKDSVPFSVETSNFSLEEAPMLGRADSDSFDIKVEDIPCVGGDSIIFDDLVTDPNTSNIAGRGNDLDISDWMLEMEMDSMQQHNSAISNM